METWDVNGPPWVLTRQNVTQNYSMQMSETLLTVINYWSVCIIYVLLYRLYAYCQRSFIFGPLVTSSIAMSNKIQNG